MYLESVFAAVSAALIERKMSSQRKGLHFEPFTCARQSSFAFQISLRY
jgi:hypothetical protein